MDYFETGDTVKLKSGDVHMIVENLDLPYNGAVTCIWITPSGEKKVSNFSREELLKVKEIKH